ncbi:MAG: hypothetical protein Q9170_000241 [Blastenia crenularia]
MEGDGHRRRQYEHQQYPRGFAPSYRSNLPEGSTAERLGQGPMMMGRSPTTASVGSATGAHVQELGSFGYPQSAHYPPTQIQGSSLQFPTDYSQEQQRSQNLPQFASPMVYNVPQQPQPRSPYDAMPQYQPRQPASMEVMTNQFGVPSYYHSAEPIGPSEHTSPEQQYASSQFHQGIPYPSPATSRATVPAAYPTGMVEYPHSVGQEVAEQQQQQQQQPEILTHREEYDQYEEALRKVFEETSQGRLIEAAQSLLQISEWLLPNAKELGLVSDNQSPREERLKVWTEFNTCWLAVLQRQKDETQRMLNRGRPATPPPNIIQETFLEKMAETLVQLCDGVEKYGLVDYQMGVWEEEIMSSKAYLEGWTRRKGKKPLTRQIVLTQCLDLLDGEGDNTGAQR